MIRHALLRTIAGALAALLLVSCVTVRVNGPASDGTPAAEESAPADSASVEEPADAAEQVAEATKTPRRRATRTPSSEATKTPRKRVTRTPSSEATKTPRKRVTRTPTAVASAPDGDEIEADSGFRPDPNGFSFENYGNEDGITNLTPADVHRMFGDDACVRFKNGECVLTPAGRKWMREVNKSMAGGHCEGFAVLSTFMYVGQISPKDFGASSVDRLKIAGNEKLQREIAYWFTTQSTTPSAESERTDMTPVQVVDELAAQFDRQAAGAADFETYSLGIYKPGYEEGHAVTPYAVNELENGRVEILVYDNNYPLEQRAILVDRKKNTWQYQASTNPQEKESLYKGTARSKTLTIAPLSVRLQPQQCPFCDEDGGGRGVGKLGAPAVEYNEIWLDGDVGLLITDAQGRRLGIVGEEMINEIPDARFTPVRSGLWADDHEPIYRIPRGVAFTATLDGRNLPAGEMASLTLIGPGYTLAVDGIELEGRQTDVIAFSADGRAISYKTATDLTPLLTVGIETDAADYEFEVIAEGDDDGQDVTLRIDPAAASLAISKSGADKTSTYDLLMTRYGNEDEEEFESTGIELAANATDYVRYGKWRGAGQPLRVEFDLDDDGVMDGSVDVQAP